jgi:hypothetical protein
MLTRPQRVSHWGLLRLQLEPRELQVLLLRGLQALPLRELQVQVRVLERVLQVRVLAQRVLQQVLGQVLLERPEPYR